MMAKFYWHLAAATGLLALAACGAKQEAVVSPKPSAQADGAIRTCSGEPPECRDATSAETAQLAGAAQALAEVDARYPSVQGEPDTWRRSRVRTFTDDGTITLESGQSVRFAGIHCDAHGIGYLRQVLMEPPAVVAYSSVETDGDPSKHAFVWTVELDASGVIVSKSAPAETALTSGWCTPRASGIVELDRRYAALAALEAAAR